MIYLDENLTFHIITVKEFTHVKGKYCVNARPFSALSFRTKGNAKFLIDGESFLSSVGDFVFIPQNMDYEVEYSDGTSIVFHFLNCNYLKPEFFSVKNFENYKLLIERALSEWQTQFSVNRVKSIIYNVFQMLCEENLPSTQFKKDEVFSECVRYINENYSESFLTLDLVCKKFFVSQANLRRKFQKYYNVSFKEYLNRLRFDKALTMLSEGKESVLTIARSCGFEDEKYFSRAVKKRLGVSPSSFRNV